MLDRRLTDRPDLSELIDGVRLAHDDLEVLYEEVRQYAAPLIFRSERCDMQVLWGEAWQQLISVHSERRIEVSSVVDTSDLWCRVDASSVKQVFRNILENSLEASGDPCRIDVEYADQVWDDRPALCVSVTDHGRGVGPEQLARMFDAFYTTKTHGTGLGMAICRRIIQKHGGDIRVSGSLGEGTTIEVILPRGSSG